MQARHHGRTRRRPYAPTGSTAICDLDDYHTFLHSSCQPISGGQLQLLLVIFISFTYSIASLVTSIYTKLKYYRYRQSRYDVFLWWTFESTRVNITTQLITGAGVGHGSAREVSWACLTCLMSSGPAARIWWSNQFWGLIWARELQLQRVDAASRIKLA